MLPIQLYGAWSDYGSFAQVSRGIAHELYRRRFNVTVKGIDTSIDHYVVDYLDCPFQEAYNSSAPIGIAIAYPEKAWQWLRGHAYKIAFCTCEADRIPSSWVEFANRLSLICVPSDFCKGAFVGSGVRVPVEVVPHGIDPIYTPPKEPLRPRPKERTRFLHVSGARSFPQRKGTPQVLLAFAQLAKKYPELTLDIQAHANSGLEKALSELGICGQANIWPHSTNRPELQRALYVGEDVLVQPSRGEGFGLCPLEARAMGVPVLLTRTTGHAMHFAPAVDIEVETDFLAPLPTQGNEVGSAPEVSVAAVRRAMETYLAAPHLAHARTYEWATSDAPKRWAWSAVLAPFLTDLRDLAKGRKRILLGAESGLQGVSEDAE